ncbi:fimbrial protein [Pantoea alhagi]|uniref:Fimbrial protein n=1 Tax=Pantoea alhagi TaxID=1891675 RepID=A0A1W6B588_9GAMM|nr:fimbrial protein [Pantoea alhagi]ARJ42246.1 fimbrial protein [Pantoea alhagi]
MIRLAIALLSTILISPGAQAVCTLYLGQPTPLAITSKVITISSDEEINTTKPIAQYDSPTVGSKISYKDCIENTEYGKRVVNLLGQDPTTKIYQTNISGIGIKLLFSNGSAFGNFPSTSHLHFNNGATVGTLDVPEQTFYRIQFFKTGRIRLNNPTGDTVLPPGLIAYSYMLNDNLANFTTSLTIGEMKIISTPACTTDNAKTVDFNTVTPTLLSAGVTRNIDFAIVCKSDYGTYSAKASIITDTPSSDGSYIRVEDAAGNKDRLRIRITDGNKQLMKVDGTTYEQKSNITSQGPAEFSWEATLIPGNTAKPAGGVFTAKAEIVFDIQ